MTAAAAVGRDDELATARAFLAASATDRRALRLTGDAGIGKTTLCRAIVEQGRQLGFTVLTASPAPYEIAAAYSVLTDLLSPIDDARLRRLPEPQCQAVLAATLRETAPTAVTPRAVAAATGSLLASLAADHPVLVVLDDEQWADTESLTALDHAFRRLTGRPIGLVSVRRSTADRPATVDLLDAFDDAAANEIGLAGLGAAEIDEVLARRGYVVPDHRARRRIHALADGNPFFAIELARGHCGDGGNALPPSLRTLVAGRVAGLSPRTRETLLVAAVVPTPKFGLIARGADRTEADVVRAVEAAERDQLVRVDRRSGAICFTHPLYREAIYAAASPRARRTVHRRVATVVADGEARALHLAKARVGPDAGLAALIENAARAARGRGASDTAVELIGHAVRLTPSDDVQQRQRRLVLEADLRFHAGEIETSRQMLDTVLSTAIDADIRIAAARTLAVVRLHQDSVAAARRLLADALEISSDAAVRADICLHMAYAAVSMADFPDAARCGARAVAEAELLDDGGLLAQAIAVAQISAFTLGLGVDEELLQRALELEDPAQPTVMAMRPSLIAGAIRLYQGRLSEALVHLQRARRTAVDRGEEGTAAVAGCFLGWTWCWLGDLRSARGAVDEALVLARRSDSASGECLALAYSAVVAAYQGGFDRSRLDAARAMELADETGYAIAPLWARWGLALAALQCGEPGVAVDAAEPLLAHVEEYGLPDPVRVVGLSDGIEALVLQAAGDRARQLTDILSESAQRHDRGWARMMAQRCRALIAAGQGDLETAQHCIDEALAIAATVELVLEAARTTMIAGLIARRRRRRSRATALLTAAAREFDRAGATGWARVARSESARAAGPRTPRTQLTETEQRVAELSATGLTNRQVAAQLSISGKTVEANLSRIYTKLGIHSRAELGARLGARRG